MVKKNFYMALVLFTTAMMVFPQLGNAGEVLKKTTDNSRFTIELTPPGDGFSVGTNSLTLNVSDAKGKGVTGAVIAITPWMPGMGHGVMLTPTVRETGKGIYTAENVGFSMPGHWELIVSVSKENVDDKVSFEFAEIAGGTAVAGKGVACSCGTGGNCPAGCLCGCQAGAKAFNCPCGTGGNCPAGCKCGCQTPKIPTCKCGPGCTTLVNCGCGPNCSCPMDGKGGCGCTVGCRAGCPNGACPLPKKLGTS